MPDLITDDGVRLHVTTSGDGPLTAIFLHCLGGNAATWERLWNSMASPGVRRIALDFRGTGQSETEPCEITNEHLARDVLLVADHFGAHSFVTVGHSMGAKLGLFLTTVAPNRIRGLALLGCPSPGLIPIQRQVLEDYLAQPDRRAATEAFFRPWFHVWPRPEIDAYLDSFARLPEWALWASCETSVWTDFRNQLAPIHCPTLVLVGAHDPMYGPDYQRQEVLPHVPHAEVLTIDCGHGLMLERPAEIAHALDRFLHRFE